MNFKGISRVFSTENGTQMLVKADDSKKIVYVDVDVDVDLTQVKRIRNGRPYTQLRRPELYA